MQLESILLPIDIAKCPLEVFGFANRLVQRPGGTLILLYVVNLNILAPENRLYEELGREAHGQLEHLAREYLDRMAPVVIHLRVGRPADEILAEAKAQRVSLILLPTSGPSWWHRVRALWRPASNPLVSPLAEKIIREADCGVFVAVANRRVNCQHDWRKPSYAPPEAAAHTASPAPVASGG